MKRIDFLKELNEIDDDLLLDAELPLKREKHIPFKKIGVQVDADDFAKRTVLSKPPPARSKICCSSRSFSRTVSAKANDVICEMCET